MNNTWTTERIAAGIDGDDAVALVRWLVEEQPAVAEGAAALQAWAQVGETPAAIAAVVRYLRQQAVTVPVTTPGMDVCGTGGSGLTRYNVSTTVAFVLAALGVPVAKHGNRGSRRPNGSFDLLDALAIPFELAPEAQAELYNELKLVFCFARTHHPIVGKVGAYRKEAGCRTIFNLSGPLANPAPIEAQLLGTAEPARMPVLAEALRLLEVPRAVVVTGEPGIDEASVAGATQWLALNGSAEDSGSFSLDIVADYAELPGGDAPVNAALFQRLIDPSAAADTELAGLLAMVEVNAALALAAWRGVAPSVEGSERQACREVPQRRGSVGPSLPRSLGQRRGSHANWSPYSIVSGRLLTLAS